MRIVSKSDVVDGAKKAGVATVKVSYSGGSDEGWVDRAELFDSNGEKVENSELSELVEEFVYDNLPGGWEINEGSYGDVEFDIAGGKAKFNHFEYVEQNNPFEV